MAKENMVPFAPVPIFLVGAERSGTTLLRLMLDHHPQIAWCFEFEYVVDLISNSGEFPNLKHYREWLETNRIFLAAELLVDCELDYVQLTHSFLAQQLERSGKSLVGATVHRHFDRLLWLWPNARFIHIVRDGRDVARSCIGMGWAGNVWTGVERWLHAEERWHELREKIAAEQFIDVVYEDLIANPVESLTRLCKFMGFSYDEKMLSYPAHTSYRLPDASLTKQWQQKLSEREIQLIESRVGDLLVKNGYELSGLPTLTVSPLLIRQLKLQDWWARLQFRRQRNGLALVVSDTISRRLGLKQWQKRIKARLNAIEEEYLK